MYKALGLISRRKKKKERKRKEGRKRQSIEWKELFAYHISGNGRFLGRSVSLTTYHL
jgi:hypothetical protein